MIAKDVKIINNLLKNSRMDLNQISKKEGIPVSTVFDRIERLRKEGVINKFSCLLNYKYLRHPLEYIFFVLGDPGVDLRINYCSSLSTPNSFVLMTVFSDLEDKEDFKKLLRSKKVKIRKQFPIYEKIKENGIILD